MSLTKRERAIVWFALQFIESDTDAMQEIQRGGGSVILRAAGSPDVPTDEELEAIRTKLLIHPPPNPLAFGNETPLKIKSWLRRGELSEKTETVQDIYDQVGRMLDKSCAFDIVGPVVFEGEDGKFYVGGVEFFLCEDNPDHIAAVKAEIEEEKTDG